MAIVWIIICALLVTAIRLAAFKPVYSDDWWLMASPESWILTGIACFLMLMAVGIPFSVTAH